MKTIAENLEERDRSLRRREDLRALKASLPMPKRVAACCRFCRSHVPQDGRS